MSGWIGLVGWVGCCVGVDGWEGSVGWVIRRSWWVVLVGEFGWVGGWVDHPLM